MDSDNHENRDPTDGGAEPEVTKILTGKDVATPVLISFIYKTKEELKFCVDKNWPAMIHQTHSYRRVLDEIKREKQARINNRVGSLRFKILTEITLDNLEYCKELIKISEIRHIDNIRGNFALNEIEWVATARMLEKDQLISHVIYSNVKDVIAQQTRVFDILWSRSMPSEIRIKELETKAKDLGAIIDKIYVCTSCTASFIFKEDVEQHTKSTEHKSFREFRFE